MVTGRQLRAGRAVIELSLLDTRLQKQLAGISRRFRRLGAEMVNLGTLGVGRSGLGGLLYLLKMKQPSVDDIVVNMVDVGEETGELDTMLYKVADVYDEQVAVLTDGLTKLIEPLLVIFLGGAVGFIVIALFIPLVSLIENLS